MAKINQYPAKTVPSNNDEFVLHDPSSGSTKKMTRGDLIGGAPLPAGSVTPESLVDTGWVTIPVTNGEYTNSTVQFRKLGGVVYTRGAVIKNSGNIPQTSWITIISNVGDEFRTPQYEEFSLPRGSSARLSSGGVSFDVQIPTSFNSSSIYAVFSYIPS